MLSAAIAAEEQEHAFIAAHREALAKFGNVTITLAEGVFALKLDIPVDRARLEKENAQLEKQIAVLEQQFADQESLAKKPEKVVAGMRDKKATYEAQLAKTAPPFNIPGRTIHWFESIGSTMTVAAEFAREGCAHGTVIVADEQTAGIGRHGHSWYSQEGGLYVSIVLRVTRPIPEMMLALGLAAREAIIKTTALQPDLRWPNDVLLNGGKCAGIIAQLDGTAVIAGIGINVNQNKFPDELEATSYFSPVRQPRAKPSSPPCSTLSTAIALRTQRRSGACLRRHPLTLAVAESAWSKTV